MTETPSPVVDIRSFAMSFGDHEVIHNLSFTVHKGEVFGLLGANGAGKTTTIRTLLALLEPTKGTLQINGQRYSPARSATVGYLPEERGLYRNEKVIDTMIYFGVLHGLSPDEARQRSLAYLKRVELADKSDEQLLKLSGGQQQKVQLGVTILHEPLLMILDEPTEALDPVNRSLLMGVINEQREKGATVMLVTHRMEEVEQLCDRILILKDGRSALYGSVDEIKNQAGTQTIALNYSGTLPTNAKLYEIKKQLPHYAELTQHKAVAVEEILRFLANDRNLQLTTFDVRRPTLNDIFINLYQGTEANDG